MNIGADVLTVRSQKFFQSLDGHVGRLQYLSGQVQVQDSAPDRRAGEVQALQDKVSQLRLQALEHGCKMEDTLQVPVTDTTLL